MGKTATLGGVEVERGGPTFDHQPALDGVRSVSVMLVLLFHAGFGWMTGGYVGVSVFFTLSGYLITSLLLTEFDATGSIDRGAFFARRLRRLLPASLLALGAIASVRLLGGFSDVANFRQDLVSAVAHIFNWARIAGDTSYSDAFNVSASLTSPVEHYWSLAIEEQFYLVWPFVMIALARRARRRVAPRLVVAFLVASALAPIAAWLMGPDAAYWSTLTRLPELLAGAALAAVMLRRRLPAAVAKLTGPSLALIVAAAVFFPSSSGPAYSGLMGVFALASVGLIVGLQGPSTLRTLLSSAPLVGLGKISYGVYLFHWPIFVWMRQRGWELDTVWGFTVAFVAVVAASLASLALIERRFRIRRPDAARTVMVACGLMLAAAIVVSILPFSRGFLEPDQAALSSASASSVVSSEPLVPVESIASSSPRRPSVAAFDHELRVLNGAVPVSDLTEAGRITTDVGLPPAGSRPVRVVVAGDSTAFYVGQALAQWTVEHPDHTTVDLVTCDGCGFILDGTVTSWPSEAFLTASIAMVGERLPETVSTVQPDVVVLMSTMSDMANRRWNDAEGVLTPLDDVFRQRMALHYQAVTDSLLEQGVGHVVWVKPPVPIWPGDAEELREVERWDVMNEVIDELLQPGVTALDADTWMNDADRADDLDFRSDGTHLTESGAYEMVDRWLAPRLVEVAFGGR